MWRDSPALPLRDARRADSFTEQVPLLAGLLTAAAVSSLMASVPPPADQHLFVAVISAILGMANGASGLILRWKVQFAGAVAWWVAAVITCFDSDAESKIVFLIAIFFCQIVFGV
jgi:hypothetical protein